MSTLVYPISPLRFGLPHYCHSDPVRRLAWQSVPLLTSPCPTIVIASQSADWRGNPFPRPRARRRGTPFYVCLRRGTFVISDKSTQKRRLKLRFKTSSARYALCQTRPMFLAQSSFPCAAVGQKDCATTAFRCRFAAAACCHGRSFPLYRRDGERAINGILAAQRAAPTPAAAPAAAGARFDNRSPHRERVSKGRGRARPFPLDASFHSAAAGKSNPAGRQNKRSPAGGGASINSE